MIGFSLLPCKKGDKTNPFSLSQRSHFFIAQVGNQRNPYLTHRIVTSAFKRRNENQIGIHAHDHFIVEIPFNAYLCGLSIFDALLHPGIEKMPGTGNTDHPVECIKLDEVRKLQGGHTDSTPNRRFNNCIPLRNTCGFHTARNKSEMPRLTSLLLGILNIDQAARRSIGHFKPLGIHRRNANGRSIRNFTFHHNRCRSCFRTAAGEKKTA